MELNSFFPYPRLDDEQVQQQTDIQSNRPSIKVPDNLPFHSFLNQWQIFFTKKARLENKNVSEYLDDEYVTRIKKICRSRLTAQPFFHLCGKTRYQIVEPDSYQTALVNQMHLVAYLTENVCLLLFRSSHSYSHLDEPPIQTFKFSLLVLQTPEKMKEFKKILNEFEESHIDLFIIGNQNIYLKIPLLKKVISAYNQSQNYEKVTLQEVLFDVIRPTQNAFISGDIAGNPILIYTE